MAPAHVWPSADRRHLSCRFASLRGRVPAALWPGAACAVVLGVPSAQLLHKHPHLQGRGGVLGLLLSPALLMPQLRAVCATVGCEVLFT